MSNCRAPDKKENRDNSGIFLYTNLFYDPSLELSRPDSSNERSQHMFSISLRNKNNNL